MDTSTAPSSLGPELPDITGEPATIEGRRAYGYVFLAVGEYARLVQELATLRAAVAAGITGGTSSADDIDAQVMCGSTHKFGGYAYSCSRPDGHDEAHWGHRDGLLVWE